MSFRPSFRLGAIMLFAVPVTFAPTRIQAQDAAGTQPVVVAPAAAKALVGRWSLIGGEEGGVAIGGDMIRQLAAVMVVTDTAYDISSQMLKQSLETGSYTIDATTTPASIDLTVTTGDDVGKTHKGIYRIDGDKLDLCVNESDGARPTEFNTKPDTELNLYRYRRAGGQ
jgi:uncharacterized protein (TIGR03067 family)